VRVVAAEADTFTREEQRDCLRILGAVVTVWRADYVHADGWPQRYRITLNFTGFSGEPETLPPASTGAAAAGQSTVYPDALYLLQVHAPPQLQPPPPL
jgi:hypothetical protein